MARRALALFLVLSWIILATVDVLEDLTLYQRAELNTQLAVGGAANDVVESADTSSGWPAFQSGQAFFQFSAFWWTSFPRSAKLHKLHHIYQI
jgi:hypothetical protein